MKPEEATLPPHVSQLRVILPTVSRWLAADEEGTRISGLGQGDSTDSLGRSGARRAIKNMLWDGKARPTLTLLMRNGRFDSSLPKR